MNGLDLVQTLFLVTIQALLDMKVISMRSKNMAQHCDEARTVELVSHKPSRLAGQVIGV